MRVRDTINYCNVNAVCAPVRVDQSPFPVESEGSEGRTVKPMDTTHEAWMHAVAEASARQDRPQLAELFAQARDLWGSQEASRMWLAAVSGFDDSAVTG